MVAPFINHLLALDRRLAAKNWPPMSRWWRRTFASFLRSNKQRLVLRVGRRGGKSSMLCRLAVAWALYGSWTVPPGTEATIAIVSVSRSDAALKLKTIAAILDADGVRYRQTAEEISIERDGTPVLFKVVSASIAGVVGFTAILILVDEVAHLRDVESGANPAREILTTLAPTMISVRGARIILSSSPRGMVDYHAELFARGNTPAQVIAYAPTWVANPTISEARTHELEDDDRVWRREYAAIPQSGSLSAFDADACAMAFNPRTDLGRAFERHGFVDASSGQSDTWAAAIGGWRATASGGRAFVIDWIGGVEGQFWKHTSGDQVVKRFADKFKRHDVRVAHGDQRDSLMLRSEFKRHGLIYRVHDWTSASKPRAVEQLRRWLLEGTLVLPEHRELRRQLLNFEERIAPSGQFTFGARSGHDDFLALLITAAMAEQERRLPGSPTRRQERVDRGAVGSPSAAARAFGNPRADSDFSIDPNGSQVVYVPRARGARLWSRQRWEQF